MPGCIFLTDRGMVKDALFLLHFPFLFLLICLFLFSTVCCFLNGEFLASHLWIAGKKKKKRRRKKKAVGAQSREFYFFIFFITFYLGKALQRAGDSVPPVGHRCLALAAILAPQLGSGVAFPHWATGARARQNHLEETWSSHCLCPAICPVYCSINKIYFMQYK